MLTEPRSTTGASARCEHRQFNATPPDPAAPTARPPGTDAESAAGRTAPALCCYTPLLSLATFAIELGLAISVLIRFRPTAFRRLCLGFLACLGIFQLSEFHICTPSSSDYWVPLAYLAITPLPAIGQHLLARITGRYWGVTGALYAVAAAFELAFLLLPQARIAATCQPLYVGLTVGSPYWNAYALYYFGALGLTLLLVITRIERGRRQRRPLSWLVLAYASFLLPTTLLLATHAVAGASIPSIMCAFALVAALIVAGRLLPDFGTPRRLGRH